MTSRPEDQQRIVVCQSCAGAPTGSLRCGAGGVPGSVPAVRSRSGLSPASSSVQPPGSDRPGVVQDRRPASVRLRPACRPPRASGSCRQLLIDTRRQLASGNNSSRKASPARARGLRTSQATTWRYVLLRSPGAVRAGAQSLERHQLGGAEMDDQPIRRTEGPAGAR